MTPRTFRRRCAAMIVAGFSCHTWATSGPDQPVSSPFVVASSDYAAFPDVAVAPDGSFVVAWEELSQQPWGYFLRFRQYDPHGNPRAPQDVDPGTFGNEPRVAIQPDGSFVVAWYGNPRGIRARFFDPAGAPRGASFEVTPLGGYFRIAALAPGGFVIAWSNTDAATGAWTVYASRHGPTGARLGEPLVVGPGEPAAVDAAADGSFVITWNAADDSRTVMARQYRADGSPAADAFEVYEGEPGATAWSPNVAVAPDGSIAIAWLSTTSQDPSFAVFVRRYDPDARPLSPATRLDTYTDPDSRPGVAIDSFGACVVSWMHDRGDFRNGYRRRVDRNGISGAPEHAVAAGEGLRSLDFRSVLDADGDELVIWDDDSRVLGQRFSGLRPVDVSLKMAAPTTPVLRDQSLAVGLSVHNANPPSDVPGVGLASGITIDTALPDGFTFMGWQGADWTCSDDAGAIRCRYAQLLAPSTSTSLRLDARAGSTEGNYPIAALLGVDQFDPDAADDESTASVAVTLDRFPDAFGFRNATGVPREVWIESAAATPVGYEAPAQVTMLGGGEYSVGGAPFTAAPGSIAPGQSLRLRIRSPATLDTAAQAKVRVGTATASFTVRTRTTPEDYAPDPFSFPNATGVPPGLLVTSAAVTPANFNLASPISITGGEYSVAGGSFRSDASTIAPGQAVRVRLIAPRTVNTSAQAKLGIGGVIGTFTVKTKASADQDPDAFAFPNAVNQPRATLVQSAAVTPAGFDTAAPISIANGEYSVAGGEFTAAPGAIAPGSVLVVRTTTPDASAAARDITVTVGATVAKWRVKTAP